MTSRAGTISAGSRSFTLFAAWLLVCATVVVPLGAPRSSVVALVLYGFVLGTVFGKAYALVPTYFDRRLSFPRAPLLHLPLWGLGVVGLALPRTTGFLVDVRTAGAILWSAGTCVFLLSIAWTIRTNPTGAETATGEAKAHRRRVDRIANAFVPLALLALVAGTYDTVAVGTGLPAMAGGDVATSHLLAVGTATLLVFAIGARLLPRFLAAPAPFGLVATVLTTGGLGPIVLVTWFAGGAFGVPREPFLLVAIGLLGVAVTGHALLVGTLCARTPRRRVGVHGLVLGACFGVLTVVIGAVVGLGRMADLVAVHPRIGLLGFLGLTIVGVVTYFYPPAIVHERWGDPLALGATWSLTVGILVELVAVVVGSPLLLLTGHLVTVAGALTFASILTTAFVVRHRSR